MVLQLLFAENTEEKSKKLKSWILWSTIWIMVMQIATSVYNVAFNKEIWQALWVDFVQKLIDPFTNLLTLLASFIFIAMAIFSFYKIVTANWEEEKVKQWKMTIAYSLVWFVIIKVAKTLVQNTFHPTCEWTWTVFSNWITICWKVTENAKKMCG